MVGVEIIAPRIQNRPRHRRVAMRLEQCQCVGRHDGDGVPWVDAGPAPRICESPAAVVELARGKRGGAMNDGRDRPWRRETGR
jgi:hypothetical protein